MSPLSHRAALYLFIGLFSIGTGVLPLSLHYCGDQLAALSVELFSSVSDDEGCCRDQPCQPEGNCCTDQDIEIAEVDQLLEIGADYLSLLSIRIWPKGLYTPISSAKHQRATTDATVPISSLHTRVRLGSLTFYG